MSRHAVADMFVDTLWDVSNVSEPVQEHAQDTFDEHARQRVREFELQRVQQCVRNVSRILVHFLGFYDFFNRLV